MLFGGCQATCKRCADLKNIYANQSNLALLVNRLIVNGQALSDVHTLLAPLLHLRQASNLCNTFSNLKWSPCKSLNSAVASVTSISLPFVWDMKSVSNPLDGWGWGGEAVDAKMQKPKHFCYHVQNTHSIRNRRAIARGGRRQHAKHHLYQE